MEVLFCDKSTGRAVPYEHDKHHQLVRVFIYYDDVRESLVCGDHSSHRMIFDPDREWNAAGRMEDGKIIAWGYEPRGLGTPEPVLRSKIAQAFGVEDHA